jgi:adenylylsulfate kinase-like enzyme
VVLCTFVSPYARDRDAVRALFPEGRFAEVHVTASLDTLRARDVKGLYAREAAGEKVGMSGVTTPYEAPVAADLVVDTSALSEAVAVDALFGLATALSPRREGGVA